MLLHNLGNGTFADITPASGLQTPFDQNFVSATWGDYDNDGFLDLYIVSHQDCQGMNTNDHLYHNNGDLTFTDVTNLLGGPTAPQRSEERRVGKECRYRWSTYHEKKKEKKADKRHVEESK